MHHIRNFVLASASVTAMALAAPAYAQAVSAASDEGNPNDIVVTGTLIRGVEPTGTKVIGVDRAAVEASGATTVTQLLQTVPQFGSFNTAQAPVGGGNTVTTNRPNLRDLASSNTNGASTTLMMIDGHRVVGMGILTTSPDLDTVAPGAIERVDVVPDGGSAIYGADAVGGVINFITRKTYDGIGINGRFGFADNYKSWDVNAIAGKTWDGGGFYVTYNYSQHDAILGQDRDYVRQYVTQSAAIAVPVIGTECRAPNVQIQNNANIYGLPLSPSAIDKLNQPNQCDYSDPGTIYPSEHRHSVFASFTQDLSDSVSFEVKGFFTDRKQRAVTGYFHTSKTVNAAARTAIGVPNLFIGNAAENQTVRFAWGPDDAISQNVHIQSWGLTPTLTANLGEGWQARLLFNYGQSLTTAHSPQFNDPALTAAITAGLFNPYNPTSSNAGALGVISNWETYGQAKQTQLQARALVDGELFELPGGPIKLALGIEYLRETLRTQKGNTVPGAQNSGSVAPVVNGITLPLSTTAGLNGGVLALPVFNASRDVMSAFGEINLPLVADRPGVRELTLSASGRIDAYSDFGTTLNPKIGLTWKPIDQLRIRGQWGTSFSAPSMANSATADPATATWSTGSTFNLFVSPSGIAALQALGYTAPTPGNSNILTLGGGSNDLGPQTAQTWSVGADLDPFEGMRLSLTYWNIKMENIIASPVGTAASNPANYFNQFLSSYIINPSQSDIAGLLNSASIVNGSPCNANPALQPSCLYIVEFNTTQNLGKFRKAGLDFAASYRGDTGFGSVDFSVAGTYLLHRQQSVSATAPLIDQILQGQSRLQMRTTAGANIGNLRAQVTWNHTAGFDFTPANPGVTNFYPTQSHYDAFNTVDLFFKYDFDGEGATKDLALTLGVNNLLDADPPVRYVGGTLPFVGYNNGSTIGRFVQVGFSKKF